jgi:hypothetical protein
MGTQSDISPPRKKNRISLFLRLWEHGRDEPVWIGEIQDVASGETIHIQNLEALFDWLRQRTGTPMHPAPRQAGGGKRKPEDDPVESNSR